MAVQYHSRIDLSPLRKLVDQIAAGRLDALQQCYRRWGHRYEAFVRRRFVKNSSGGGDWPKLKSTTMKARRSGTRKGKGVQILRDTGTVHAALSIGAKGNHFQLLRDGCEFGFGGTAAHPEGHASIADIARFHDQGAGHLPKRQIIVEPDAATVAAMAEDVKWAINRVK